MTYEFNDYMTGTICFCVFLNLLHSTGSIRMSLGLSFCCPGYQDRDFFCIAIAAELDGVDLTKTMLGIDICTIGHE